MSVSSRLRQILGALGVGYLGLAAWNANVYRRTYHLEFPEPLPGDAHIYQWPGGDIYYTTQGQGEPLLLVHAIYAGADSHEFAPVWAPLAERYQLYAYDLLGFGHSARPNLHYSGPLYVRLMVDFVRHVIGRPVTILANSLSAGHAIRAAAEEPDLIRRLILEAPTGATGSADRTSIGAQTTYLAFNLLPDLGEGLRNVIASRPFISRYLKSRVYYDPSKVTDDLVEYYYRSAHQPGGQYALAAFFTERLNVPVEDALRSAPQPLALIWGRRSRMTPVNAAWRYLRVRPDATLHVIEDSGIDVIHEQPEAYVSHVIDILSGREKQVVGEEALAEMAPPVAPA